MGEKIQDGEIYELFRSQLVECKRHIEEWCDSNDYWFDESWENNWVYLYVNTKWINAKYEFSLNMDESFGVTLGSAWATCDMRDDRGTWSKRHPLLSHNDLTHYWKIVTKTKQNFYGKWIYRGNIRDIMTFFMFHTPVELYDSFPFVYSSTGDIVIKDLS